MNKRSVSCPPLEPHAQLPMVSNTFPAPRVFGETTLFNRFGSKNARKHMLRSRNQRIRGIANSGRFVDTQRKSMGLIPLATTPAGEMPSPRFFAGTVTQATPRGG